MSRKSKTICFVAAHYHKKNIGGAEVQMFLLASQLASSGWKVIYLSPDIESVTVDQGISLKPIRSFTSNTNFENEVTAALDKINPDIIYQRGRSRFTSACRNYCRKTQTPLIFALSMDIDCRLFRNMLRAREYHSRNPLRWLWSALSLGLSDIRSFTAMKDAHMIFCQTDYQKKLIGRFRKKGLVTIRNMHPKPISQTDKKIPPVVLWLASVKTWKQPDLFLELVQKMRTSHCHFVMAGRMANEKYRQPIAEMTKTDNFSYIEAVDLELSNVLISSASVFVNTSLGNEGFPNTFIQSWLRGVPTVSLQFDPDCLITEKKLGFISQTMEQMIKDVQFLIDHDEARRKLGVRAKLFAEKTFGSDQVFPKVNKIIQNMVS